MANSGHSLRTPDSRARFSLDDLDSDSDDGTPGSLALVRMSHSGDSGGSGFIGH